MKPIYHPTQKTMGIRNRIAIHRRPSDHLSQARAARQGCIDTEKAILVTIKEVSSDE
ncbi:MAG: hypothetical protein LBD02_01340 [Christensenellaceae bacterium]|nr:hypothetical protein [Christensenellaceae bacterium]